MRKSKASNKRQPTKARVAKRTTSRRATTSRSRTSRATARRTRRVSPKSIPPLGLIEIPKLRERAVAATPPLPSKRYPIRNLLVLFLAFAATTAVGGWAVYVALFGGAHQDIEFRHAAGYRRCAPRGSPERRGAGTEGAGSRCGDAQRGSNSKHQPGAAAARAGSADEAGPDRARAKHRTKFKLRSGNTAAIAREARGHGSRNSRADRRLDRRQFRAASTDYGEEQAASALGQPAFLSPGGPVSSAYALVTEARRYLGTNPTGRKDLWCGAFLDMVLKRIGYKGGGNLASAYARYGTRLSGPQIGAIAVIWRQGGGHVGIVTGLDTTGNPIIISGNYQKRVAEAVYPRGRIYAYVVPSDRQRVAAARAQVTADDLR